MSLNETNDSFSFAFLRSRLVSPRFGILLPLPLPSPLPENRIVQVNELNILRFCPFLTVRARVTSPSRVCPFSCRRPRRAAGTSRAFCSCFPARIRGSGKTPSPAVAVPSALSSAAVAARATGTSAAECNSSLRFPDVSLRHERYSRCDQ